MGVRGMSSPASEDAQLLLVTLFGLELISRRRADQEEMRPGAVRLEAGLMGGGMVM